MIWRRVRAPFSGTTERRLALVVLLSAVIPALLTWMLARSMAQQTAAVWFNEEVSAELDRGVESAEDHVAAQRQGFGYLALALARDPELEHAAQSGDPVQIEATLQRLLAQSPDLRELRYDSLEHGVLARARAEQVPEPLDEHRVEQHTAVRGRGGADDRLVFVFHIGQGAVEELHHSHRMAQYYRKLEAARTELARSSLRGFAVLLVVTALGTAALGVVLARGVTKRIARLGVAVRTVAEGDLSVRVPVTGSDELTELARHFNRMAAQVAHSRARVEFLQRMASWQEMARRLAHEIKNPLTPIQLAVEECQRRYDGSDPQFTQLLATTGEVVREEVAALRHLVEHFAQFARLPAPQRRATELNRFLRELAAERQVGDDLDAAKLHEWPKLELRESKEPAWVQLDRQLFRRVLVNLLDNASDATREGPHPEAAVSLQIAHVTAEDGDHTEIELVVADRGAGVAKDELELIFDPYVTHKSHGTGLGLAIVKKVVVEHQGNVRAERREGGGLRVVIRLPRDEAPH